MFISSFLKSFLFLFAIIYIYINFGTTNLRVLLNIGIIPEIQFWLFLAFMSSFVIKIPLWPFNFFIISSIDFPGTRGFVGGILLFIGSWKLNSIIIVISLFGLIIGSFFVISLHRRIMYGSPKNHGSDILDISIKEILTFFPLVFLIIILGFLPNILLEFFDKNSNFLINIMENLN